MLMDVCFFFNDTATTEIYTLSLHDALPIWIGAPPEGSRRPENQKEKGPHRTKDPGPVLTRGWWLKKEKAHRQQRHREEKTLKERICHPGEMWTDRKYKDKENSGPLSSMRHYTIPHIRRKRRRRPKAAVFNTVLPCRPFSADRWMG